CDSAETTLIQGLRSACIRAKLPLRVEKAKKSSITDRIRFLCRMMASGRYYIMDNCTHTRDALCSAVWDSKKLEDVRLDDGTTNIDSLDALEYSFEPYMESMTYAGGWKTT
ncbi:MAG TPA: PBSX family phage terminase large subunit, partial [Gammaproteobacteria bacterium]|nr:PBSX family phage terminase large subunit [Gammaproteobacteria bacterium]